MAVYTTSPSDKGVVSCDWFALSCKLAAPRDGEPLVAPSEWSCLRMSPTAVWAERWFVMDCDGNKVATILCSPRSPKIPCLSCLVEIANRWLYYDDFRAICDRVLSILPMAIAGVNRVDLCCDFEMDEAKWLVFRMLAKGEAYIKALRQGSVWWQDIRTSNMDGVSSLVRVPHCLTFGGKESTFKWKVYYKWLELQQADPEAKKPYIVDLWKQMGLVEQAVWRVEVSVSSANSLCSVDGSRILPFDWFENRTQLFSDIYFDKFVVRAADGHKDKRNDRVLPFLEVDGKKFVRYALPAARRDDSDPERRLTSKLWAELQQSDVDCNPILRRLISTTLMELLERPSNVWVLQRQYGVSVDDIAIALAE